MTAIPGPTVALAGGLIPLAEALKIDAAAARLVIERSVVAGMHYEHPIIFNAVRRALGLSQGELGLVLGYGRGDPDKAARTVRLFEQIDGDGPTLVSAFALRWLALERGLLIRT
jgi:hypothetical protein